MPAETLQPKGEQQGVDPVQSARSAFNKILLGKEYNGGALFGSIIKLQNALLASNLTPEKVYHELSIVSGQAVDCADLNTDPDTASTLSNLQKGYELTYENFRPRRQSEAQAKPSEPTKTQNLPPMTGVKGAEIQTKTPTSPEASTTQPEGQPDTSSTENPQQPKKRGRKPKSTGQ